MSGLSASGLGSGGGASTSSHTDLHKKPVLIRDDTIKWLDWGPKRKSPFPGDRCAFEGIVIARNHRHCSSLENFQFRKSQRRPSVQMNLMLGKPDDVPAVQCVPCSTCPCRPWIAWPHTLQTNAS